MLDEPRFMWISSGGNHSPYTVWGFEHFELLHCTLSIQLQSFTIFTSVDIAVCHCAGSYLLTDVVLVPFDVFELSNDQVMLSFCGFLVKEEREKKIIKDRFKGCV